jgi:hypothetical protein
MVETHLKLYSRVLTELSIPIPDFIVARRSSFCSGTTRTCLAGRPTHHPFHRVPWDVRGMARATGPLISTGDEADITRVGYMFSIYTCGLIDTDAGALCICCKKS